MNKPLTTINRKLDEFVRSLERSRRKADFVEGLRRDGWQGDDEQIISDFQWLMLPKGAKELPEPEPEVNEEDDEEADDE